MKRTYFTYMHMLFSRSISCCSILTLTIFCMIAPVVLAGNTEVVYETARDFGVVKEGKALHYNFAFKNKTREIINIVNVNTSCGCTTSRLSRTTLKPGEKTIIKTSVDTKGYYGPMEQHVYLHTDHPDIPFVTYTLKATVKPRDRAPK